MKNKAGTYFGRKVELDGYVFDSQKEADFYQRFIKNSGYQFEVHPRFILEEATMMTAITYAPDFVIYDRNGHILHVYDVKSSLDGRYGVNTTAKLRFNLFQRKFKKAVEAVVPRKNDFKMRIYGLRKNVNTRQISPNGKVQFYDIMQNIDYDPAKIFDLEVSQWRR